MKDVIVALATAPLKSALAIVRVSGEDSFSVVSKIFSKDITNEAKNKIHHGFIKNNENIVDEVVLLTYVSPTSFTGENSVEIMCHGSVLIANEIIELLISKGARMAERGEFTSRALLNKKLDLIQAEAVNDVINAKTRESKKLSLLSLEGKTSDVVRPLKDKIANLLSLIEVNIDYPEYYDIEIATNDKVIKDCEDILSLSDTLIDDSRQGQLIKDGINVALVGKPNVGKSSILNALLKEDKAIVSNIPGTTRDVVEGEISYNGVIYHFFDTAGIRESDNVIEQMGIEKTRKSIENADVVVQIIDSLEEKEEINTDKPLILVQNKVDLNKEIPNLIHVSALNNNIKELLDKLEQVVGIKEEAFNKPSLNNSRQIGLLKQVRDIIASSIEDAKNEIPLDLISSNLYNAYQNMLEILGETNTMDLDKEIFARFCVGK